ncbi:hypothetical protein [Streptomyces sp. NPDC002779]|uniref:hypothetical protein n=1 Tax=Streptomyces sp. NPDC002779 TaxID=3364664 RepID=UPI0036A22EEC
MTITNHANRLGLPVDREATGAATDRTSDRPEMISDQARQRLMDFFNHQLDRAREQAGRPSPS